MWWGRDALSASQALPANCSFGLFPLAGDTSLQALGPLSAQPRGTGSEKPTQSTTLRVSHPQPLLGKCGDLQKLSSQPRRFHSLLKTSEVRGD